MPPPSRRVAYALLALITIGAGLLVHLRGAALGAVGRDVAGDALWATMIAWWVGACRPRARLRWRSATAYAICVAVELSQLWHAPALDAIRATSIGGLVLGSGFDPRDLLAYLLGVAAATALEVAWRLRRMPLLPPSPGPG